MNKITNLVTETKEVAAVLARYDLKQKNQVLSLISENLEIFKTDILHANQEDVAKAEQEGLEKALLKRLYLDEQKLAELRDGIKELIQLPDPVGQIQLARALDQDLDLFKVSTPLGVIGVIFESRPDALVQIACLCLKSGNGVVLKGGSEATKTNQMLATVIEKASEQAGLSKRWLTLLQTRDDVNAMLKLEGLLDLIIPRGSNEFVKYIMQHTTIPVLGHADGVCHLFIDQFADLDMALNICLDSKLQYTAVCNAVETILIHRYLEGPFLSMLLLKFQEAEVLIHGDEEVINYARDLGIEVLPVKTWHHEYLDKAVSLHIVENLSAAIKHINNFGSGHTESIISKNEEHAYQFMRDVNSANVFWNCSTRFSDGYRYGFGAEVGVSTSKIHARGPVGLEGLLTYKYKLFGKGQIVRDYAEHKKEFNHKDIEIQTAEQILNKYQEE